MTDLGKRLLEAAGQAREIAQSAIPEDEMDGICRMLLKLGKPITRENWIALAYCNEPPEEWTEELEEELPPSLRTDLSQPPHPPSQEP